MSAVTFRQGVHAFLLLWLEHRFVPDFTTPYMDGQSRKTPLYGELLQFMGKMTAGMCVFIMLCVYVCVVVCVLCVCVMCHMCMCACICVFVLKVIIAMNDIHCRTPSRYEGCIRERRTRQRRSVIVFVISQSTIPLHTSCNQTLSVIQTNKK